jgi:hypothetical protein
MIRMCLNHRKSALTRQACLEHRRKTCHKVGTLTGLYSMYIPGLARLDDGEWQSQNSVVEEPPPSCISPTPVLRYYGGRHHSPLCGQCIVLFTVYSHTHQACGLLTSRKICRFQLPLQGFRLFHTLTCRSIPYPEGLYMGGCSVHGAMAVASDQGLGPSSSIKRESLLT